MTKTGAAPEIIKRKKLWKGKAFSVVRLTCIVGAERIKREVIVRRDGVVVVPVDQDLNVYMLSEYCAGSNSFVLSFPGGSIDAEDADIAQAAQRELREETGFRAEQLHKLRFAYEHPSTSTRRSHVFLGYDLAPDPLPASGEILEVVVLPLEKAIARAFTDYESDVSTIGNLLMARDKLRALGVTS